MHLLYVDDDRINLVLFEHACSALQGSRLRLSTAGNGAEALATAQRERPDLLVIDLHLPDTSGLDLLRSMRALPGLSGVPAFLCTADEGEAVRAAAREAGFAKCWTKPIDIQVLRADLAGLDPSLAA